MCQRREMGEIAAAWAGAGEDTLAERVLRLRVPITWEGLAYAVIFLLATGMRFWDLGSRAMHHDESLHAYYSYQLFRGMGYEHSPLLHGPFQFFGMALTYFLAGGASDATARVAPAVAGSVLVVLPVFFRSHLGRAGALATSALIAFSPSLLYYSRFAREDIYAAVFTLTLVVCLWRYLAEKKDGYLYGAGFALALAFATKENAFITSAIVVLFLDLAVAGALARQTGRHMGDARRAYPFYLLAYAPVAWLIVALWPFTGGLRRRFGLTERAAGMDALLVVGTLAGPQFAAAARPLVEAAGLDVASGGAERLVAYPTVIGLLAASAAVGLAWDKRRWALAAASFYLPYTLLFTSFLTHPEGFASGIWDSLDYWLGQHGQRRGDQPEFYYLMFFPAYETVTLLLALPALLYYSLRGGWRSWLLTSTAVLALLAFFGADSFAHSPLLEVASVAALPAAAVAVFAAVRGTAFERFLVFWTIGSLVAYSYVGEKMPWLSVHTTLPAALLAGYVAGRLWEGWRSGPGVELEPRGTGARLLSAARVALALAVAGVALFTLRTAVYATYDHGDVPREFLFYTQTAPDVPRVVEAIDRLAVSTGQGSSLRVQVDRAFPWPWAWYLRNYQTTFETVDAGFRPEAGAVLLVGGPDDVFTGPYRGGFQPPRRYTLRWWFPEGYRSLGANGDLAEGLWDFVRRLSRWSSWRRWLEYLVQRDVSPQGIDGLLYIPLEYGAALTVGPPEGGPPQPTGTAAPDLEGRLVIGRIGSEAGQLMGPVGVALGGGGVVWVADSGNARVQAFDTRGLPVGAWGSAGGEPGQFNQPSGVAVAPDGSVYVADTWNHRIQKFGPDMSFLGSFGKATADLLNPAPDEMWGPRGVAVDGDGNVWVTDTGTHRVRKFGPDGSPIASFGSRGHGPRQFVEPVGIAIGPDGSVFVADAGNARIQKFAPDLSFVAEFPVPQWADRDARNKPYLAALPDGRLLATDGPHGRVLLIGQDGRVQAEVGRVGELPLFFPAGVAYDAGSGYVYVTDGVAGFVARFPLTDFALR